MEFDFSKTYNQIVYLEQANALANVNPLAFVYSGIWPSTVSRNILTTLKPYLDQITPESSPELLHEMESLYEKAVAITPVLSLAHFAKGQFHQACGEADKAVRCFRAAYEIDRDSTRQKWPHLQATEGNARLMFYLGKSLILAGAQKEGERFVRGSHNMAKMLEPIDLLPDPQP